MQIHAMDCNKKSPKPVWIELEEMDDEEALINLSDQNCGCCDCGIQQGLELFAVGSNCFWLQCTDCGYQSSCESQEAAHYDDYMDYGYDDKDEIYFEG